MAELADAHGSGYTTSVNLQNSGLSCKNTKNFINADMAELADAHGSGYTTSVNLQNHVFYLQKIKYADMAELADAHGSGDTPSV